MAFIGAIIQTVKGISTKVINKNRLNKLKVIESSSFLELIPKQDQSDAIILIKQVELQDMIFKNVKRKIVSDKEKEILHLMKQKIEEKRIELQKEKATQFDVANLLLTIQQLSHETIEEHSKIREELKNNHSCSIIKTILINLGITVPILFLLLKYL